MRVVQLLTQTSGGPVDHAVDVAAALGRRGHDSHVIGPVSAGTALAREAGVTWHDLHITDKRDLGGASAVVRRIRALKPAVLHLQDRRAGLVGRLIAPTLRETGCVYTLHGVADGLSDLVVGNACAAPRRRRDQWYYLHGERWLTAWGRCRVVVPSIAVADYAVEHVGLDPHRVHVVPNGIDADRFAPRANSVPASVLRVGWLGMLVEVKRLDTLVEAVARVPDVHLSIAGDGPLRSRVEESIEAAGIAARVEMLGMVSDPTDFFGCVDAFALSSAAENCPLSLLQAMACGLPSVATSVGGVPEIVRDGVDGLLVPVGDVTAMTTALERLAHRREESVRMGRSARSRIEQGYTIEVCVAALESVYERSRACVS